MGKFNFNQKEFEKIRDEAEKLYRIFGSTYCERGFGWRKTFLEHNSILGH